MTKENIDALIARMEKLESQNIKLKRAGITAMIVVAIAILAVGAARNTDTIEARRFILLDEQGRRRGEMTAHGSALLVFYDRNGDEQMTLDIDHLAFFDAAQPKGSPARILLQVLHGEPTLWLARRDKIIWSAP